MGGFWSRGLVLLLAVAATGLTSCGDEDEGAPEGSATATVDIVDFRFKPPTITIAAGGEVRWLNSDVAPHTATVEDRKQLDTGTLRTGESDAVVFRDPGSYPYI